MAGLTLLLEAQKSRASKKSGAGSGGTTTATPQILSKADMVRLFRAAPKRQGRTTGSSSSGGGSGFLEACYLCRRRLSPEKDIYMYRGDRAFCSVECRMRQIGMDEESMLRDKCGIVASAASSATSSSPSSSSSSTARPRNGVVGKSTRPGVPAGFAY